MNEIVFEVGFVLWLHLLTQKHDQYILFDDFVDFLRRLRCFNNEIFYLFLTFFKQLFQSLLSLLMFVLYLILNLLQIFKFDQVLVRNHQLIFW